MKRRLVQVAAVAVAAVIIVLAGFFVMNAEKDIPMFALVLDDFGYTGKNLDAVRDMGIPLTMAVLPNVPYSAAVCSFAQENGLEVILHLPMEPEDRTVSMEECTISGDMSDETVKENIAGAFHSVYTAMGVSNHMGSRATGDSRLMTVVLSDLKKRNMFFLDSCTTGNSVCGQVAVDTGVPYISRDIFIDNKREEEYIRQQLEKAEKRAFSKGSVVAIGHDSSATIDVLRKVIPGMKKRGIRFVKLSEVVAPAGKR